MAELPDLDTSSISFIAYYNIIDQEGDDQWEADQVLTAPGIVDYTLYDNGVEGTYQIVTGREVTFRAKNDGWIIAYMDRTQVYSDDGSPRGYQDLINDYTDNDGPGYLDRNSLERAVNDMRQESDGSSTHNYDYSKTGLYNYEYTAAQGTTGLAAWSGGTFSYTITGSTTTYRGVVYAANASRYEGRGNFDWNNGAWDNGEYNTGANDMSVVGGTDVATEFEMSITDKYNNDYGAHGGVVIVWS